MASAAGPLRGLQRPHRYTGCVVAADFRDFATSTMARFCGYYIRDGSRGEVSAGRPGAALLAACAHAGWTVGGSPRRAVVRAFRRSRQDSVRLAWRICPAIP